MGQMPINFDFKKLDFCANFHSSEFYPNKKASISGTACSMWSRVYATAGNSSVHPIWLPHATAADLLLWTRRAGDTDELLHGVQQQQQQRANAGSTRCQRTQEAEHRLVS